VRPEVARAAVDAARCPVGDNSSTSRCAGRTAGVVRGEVGKPVAGKSGTTESEKAAALVVMTRQLAVAGILADPDWAETTYDMEHDIVNPAVYLTLKDAMKGKPSKQFTPPNGKIVLGDQRAIPGGLECGTVAAARSRLEAAGFKVEVDNQPVTSPCPAGSVAGTTPEGRTIKNGVVIIQLSDGKGAPTGTPGPGNPPGRGGGGGPGRGGG
jgi:hypothetical protein